MSEGARGDKDRFRPARIWRSLDAGRKLKAAAAFWKSDAVKDADRQAAVIALAQSLRFRPQTIRTAPAAKRAQYLASHPALPDHLAASLLYAYHLEAQAPMLTRFLDLLGIAHEAGRITGEVKAPDAKGLEEAAGKLLAEFDPADVAVYFETLVSQDASAWGGLEGILEARAPGAAPGGAAD